MAMYDLSDIRYFLQDGSITSISNGFPHHFSIYSQSARQDQLPRHLFWLLFLLYYHIRLPITIPKTSTNHPFKFSLQLSIPSVDYIGWTELNYSTAWAPTPITLSSVHQQRKKRAHWFCSSSLLLVFSLSEILNLFVADRKWEADEKRGLGSQSGTWVYFFPC